ncbi:MAG: glycosyltransferase [Gammaproteobacteria bacterium]
MSTHYLFVTWDGGGNVAPELGVARALVDRGHRVTVLADDTIRPEAIEVGAAFVAYERGPNNKSRAVDSLRDWECDPVEAGTRSIKRIMCGSALGIAQDVVAVHEADPIDCVVSCYFLFGGMIGAERASLPCVVLCPNVDFREAPGRPGFGPGLHPLPGPEGEARDREMWAGFRALFELGQPALNDARKALGLPTLTHPWDELARVERVILLTSRHFEYPYELQPNTLFAGPVLADPSWNERAAPVRRSRDRSLILVSLGSSFQNQIESYRNIVAALGRLPVDAVVTLGNVFDPSELEAPRNVEVVRSAPHAPLLEQAAVMVSHCGHGSAMKALAAGVPLLCLPLGRDQLETAARVVWHGAGLRLDHGATTEEIGTALKQLLDDVEFRTNARRLGQAIRDEVEQNIAIMELEKIRGKDEIRRIGLSVSSNK